jgi:5'-3' exonuclease
LPTGPITPCRKTVRRCDGAGAILGVANFLLRLHDAEKPCAVLVAWDTLEEPTYRRDALERYQASRTLEVDPVDELEVLPTFLVAYGFASAKAAG